MKRLLNQQRRQRGAATLVVVMVLFLVMALLAAYANRSLMFEQRISGSYYRASMAQEMAEGGIDWTVAMLNGPAADNSCNAVATGGTRFVDRYLNVSAADRAVLPVGSTPVAPAVDCVRDGSDLVCRCAAPDTRTAQPATTVANSLAPSFLVALGSNTTVQYGSFSVTAIGCTDSSADSCNRQSHVRSESFLGASNLDAAIAFVAAVPSSPATPLTVKGALTSSGAGGLGLHNTDPTTGGGLLVSGGATAALNSNRMDTLPGTPPAQALRFSDTTLQGIDDKQFFQTFMGMAPARYRNHPALRTVTCAAGADCGPALQAAYASGVRILRVPGALTIGSNVAIGTPSDPLLVVAEGAVTLTGPMQLTGMLVALGNLSWTNTGGLTSVINGMVTVQGSMQTNGRMDIVYQQEIANQLRNRIGSYVRISGGMRDLAIN